MKNSLLIHSGFSNQFRAKTIDMANYLQNWLPIKHVADKVIIILKEAWIETRQNLKHIQIFSNTISSYIPNKKCSKSDIQKT